MTERVLSARALNRALLARQGLLERVSAPIPRMLERMGGLQAQYAPSMYIGLWSRLDGFEREALTRALEARSVIQATLMRSTIHLVSAADYWPLAVAVREARREHWMRATRREVTDAEMEAAAERLRVALADGATLRRKQLDQLLGKPAARAVGLWVDLVRAPPSGTWERRRADLYALAEDWIAPVAIPRDEAVAHLVRRYLGAFGPATAKDVVSFTGLPARELEAALGRLDLRRFRSEQRRSCSTSRAPRCPIRTRRHPCASSPPSTRPCSCTPAAPACCPRSTARASSTRRPRSRSRPSSSTGPSPAPGASSRAGSS